MKSFDESINDPISTNNDVVQIVEKRSFLTEDISIRPLTCLLAVEVIVFLLTKEKYSISLKKVLSYLNIDPRSLELSEDREHFVGILGYLSRADGENSEDLITTTKTNFFSLYNQSNVSSKESILILLSNQEKQLKQWYSIDRESKSVKNIIKDNSSELRKKIHEQLEQIIQNLRKNNSIEPNISFLTQFKYFLENLEFKYQNSLQKFVDNENSSLRVFKRYVYNIENNQGSPNKNYRIASSALSSLYEFKIKSAIYSLATQILRSMIYLIDRHLYILNQSSSLLNQIKENCLVEAKINNDAGLLLSLVYKEVSNYLDFNSLKQKLEASVGCSVSSWGSYNKVTINQIQTILIKELQPVSTNICYELYHKLEQILLTCEDIHGFST